MKIRGVLCRLSICKNKVSFKQYVRFCCILGTSGLQEAIIHSDLAGLQVCLPTYTTSVDGVNLYINGLPRSMVIATPFSA